MKSLKKFIVLLLVFFLVAGIAFAEKNITIEFNKNKILCTLIKNNNFTTLKNHSTVSEGAQLNITVQNLPYNKVVSEWIIGNKKIKAKYNSFDYRVSKKDLNASNQISISYKTRKAKKFTIIFDDSKFKCENNSKTYKQKLKNKGKAFERNSLEFIPRNINPNNTVTCIIGKTTDNIESLSSYELHTSDDSFMYTVNSDEANSKNEIRLTYIERKKEKIAINFDESKIKCVSTRTNQAVKSGSKILEGTKLNFKTVSDKAVIWNYGNISNILPISKRLNFKVHKSMLPKDEKAIVVSYKNGK